MAIKINKKELDEIYGYFQFEKLEETEKAVVYAYNTGYFNNIEIFSFESDQTESILDLKEKYEEVGFSVRVVTCDNLQELHDKLFRGFFRSEKYIQLNKSVYLEHCKSESMKLALTDSNAKYEYVQGNFYKDGVASSSENIIVSLGKEMQDNQTKLIILEAAAGMGKTSTSYEVLNYLLTQRGDGDLAIPILIELTKNRSARIFRHVLDDEIDRNFSGLKRDLVLREIKNGNILLIIDGFDELLVKRAKEIDDENEGAAQSMLDTIADLFEDSAKTKIILTSRKSSIFIGEQFDNWADTKLPNIQIHRYQLAKPTILQWLGEEKVKIMQEKKVPIQSLENPVLLSFYKYSPIEEIKNINEEYSVVDKYFEKMLEREVNRQQLRLSVSEQKDIFVQLAKWFVLYDINSDTSEFIKSLFLSEILKDKMLEYFSRYFDATEKPADEEEYAMKLVHHALLDRVAPHSNNIGFINDLVFGTLIAEAIIKLMDFSDLDSSVNARFILLASDAYAFEKREKRERLYKKIEKMEGDLEVKQKLTIELDLLQSTTRDFFEEYIDNIMFVGANLNDGSFNFCTFVSCVFEECSLDLEKVTNCTFINCKFYNVTLINEDKICHLCFSNCIGSDVFPKEKELSNIKDEINYQKIVLENFWKPGKSRAESQRSENAIYRGTQPSMRSSVAMAIQELESKNILKYSSGFYYLSHEKIVEIRKLLGRD